MKKRFLSIFLTLCMVLTLLPISVLAVDAWSYPTSAPATPFNGGSGIISAPYEINTAQQLANLAYLVNNGTSYNGLYFKLTADIILNDVSNLANWGTSAPTNVWTPIGTYANRFKGNFDGNNKTVSGIYIKTTDNSQGLFGCVDTCSISNLNVTSSYILGNAWVAGIAGWVINQTIITNCHNSATVIGAQDVGGVAGVTIKDTGTVSVSGCSNSGNVSASEKHAGGIAGVNNGIVANSYNTGSISGYNAIGGVVGYNAQATTANCYNTGAVNSTDGSAGGIVGESSYHAGTYIYNCYNTGNVTGVNPGAVCGASSSIVADCYWKFGSAASGFSTNSGTATDIYSFSGSGTNWTLSNGAAYSIGTSNVAIGGSLLTALSAWVTYTNSSTYNTWAADIGSSNGGYPIFGTAYVPVYAPGAPTIGTASAGNGQASVSFTAPASNGGSAITGYTVTSNPGGKTGTGIGSPITVTGLTNGTAYTFTVTATNSVGTSSPSSVSNSVTPVTVPGAPTIGTATAGNGQASVSFTAPASNGGAAITGYTVTSSPGGFIGTGAASPITVTGLTNGTAYTFNVTATNSAGTGAASAASNSVTPLAAPTVSSVAVPSNATYIANQNLDFVVNFSSPVNVVTTGGTPYLALTIGGTDVHASYNSGSGTMSLTFRYTVLPGDSDTDGITVSSPLTLNGGTIKDGAGNNASLVLNTIGNTGGVKVDATAPAAITGSASSITSTGATLGGSVNANNISTTVTFQYGTTAGYGSSETAAQSPVTGTSNTTVNTTLSGLTQSTTYHFRVKAVNSKGTTYGNDMTFTTAAAPAPSGGGSYTSSALVTHIDNGGSTTGSNLGQLVSGGKTLTVDDNNKGAKLVFDTEALKGISGQTSSDIKVEMKDVSPEHQETLPGKQVFSLTVSSGSTTITNFGGAVTVTLPYTLKDGESANDVTVWYLANDGTMTEIPCTYDPATKLATFTVTHFSLYVVGVPWNNPFTDVKENDWFYSAVEFVSSNGMMKGIGGTDFSPNTTVTRGMLVTILWRLENEPATAKTISFSDVSDGNWYAKAVVWAAANNIVTGYAGKFNPDDALTREQLAAILYRYAAYKNYDVSAGESLSAYADKPSDWAFSSVSWAVAKGLIKGSGGSLDPKGSATRAQTATILQRFIETAAK